MEVKPLQPLQELWKTSADHRADVSQLPLDLVAGWESAWGASLSGHRGECAWWWDPSPLIHLW